MTPKASSRGSRNRAARSPSRPAQTSSKCSPVPARYTNDQAERSTSRLRRWAGSGAGRAATTSCPTHRSLPRPGSSSGSDRMVLDRTARTVWLKSAGMKLDAGGIAKGYAAQAALDVLKRAGINRALVGGAGDIVVGDAPPGKKGWTIAIAPLEPGRPGGAPPALLLANAAVSTAGDAERFVIIDGHRYSHIINPATGQGVEDRASVTVVASDGGNGGCARNHRVYPGAGAGVEVGRGNSWSGGDFRTFDAGGYQDV